MTGTALGGPIGLSPNASCHRASAAWLVAVPALRAPRDAGFAKVDLRRLVDMPLAVLPGGHFVHRQPRPGDPTPMIDLAGFVLTRDSADFVDSY